MWRTTWISLGVCIVFFLASAGAPRVNAAEEKTTFVVKHLCCGACGNALSNALKKVDGVTNITTKNGAPGEVTVSFDSAKVGCKDCFAKKVVKAAHDAGFVVEEKK